MIDMDDITDIYNESVDTTTVVQLVDCAKQDQGQHYRFEYGGVKLDPFRIAQIYGMTSFAMMTILKKCLCAGKRGHKDYRQDLRDIICAAERELQMLEEDFL